MAWPSGQDCLAVERLCAPHVHHVKHVVMLADGPCAAGPTSAEAGNTVMQAAESAAASSNNALTPGEEAFSSQQAAVNPAFGGSMPWGGPSTATYAFDYDSSQALEGMGSTGPDVDFDLDGQDSQALGFSQPTGAAGSAAAAATSDRLQSDAQSQLQQGPETGPEVWGHQQQEQESCSGKERVEGHGERSACYNCAAILLC